MIARQAAATLPARELLESGFVDRAEETDKVPFAIVLANNT